MLRAADPLQHFPCSVCWLSTNTLQSTAIAGAMARLHGLRTAAPGAHPRANPWLLGSDEKYNPCMCGLKKTNSGDDNHEVDLVHFVVGLVGALVVCLDPSLVVIQRVWCVAEIGKALRAGSV
eukprot:TRINITY_DN18865_c0_g5_i1.p2 TRINITY_DN18865_c0_g5~~TRINITY_DN18865_c0_g5_i1.p2  ORF type:complete len:122 (-),score=13.62 TRINITY_DN18865_c0_g5_i1:591-956(-)